MGDVGGSGDAQRAKTAAVAAYDYEGDPRWAEYWSNVLIPPHLASRSDVIDHFKRKFYHRFLGPEFVVANMSKVSYSQSTRASTTYSSTLMREHARPQNSRSSSGASTASSPSSGVNCCISWCSSHCTEKSFEQGISVVSTRHSSVFFLFNTLHGKPTAWNLHGVQSWFQSVITTKDFIHFTYCLMLISSRVHFKFALLPVICWAVEHVAKFLRRNFSRSLFYRRYLEKACVWGETNTNTLNILCSNAEIALGFVLVISLLSSQRNILQTFMYWQLLKLMYHAPATAGYHQSVWAKIGRAANPYIYRFAPFLSTPISIIQRWWFR